MIAHGIASLCLGWYCAAACAVKRRFWHTPAQGGG
nr:MAG TPA: hypothetical protein [Caudoviricetes sp.]